MSAVIPFKQREASDPHLSGQARCIGCGHEWVAVAPVGVWQFECPACQTMKGIHNYPVGPEAGDLAFQCNCGCEALTAYQRDGLFFLRCMSCGTDHTMAVFGE